LTDTPEARYAVYYALPRDCGTWRLAQSWLGRDCESGAALPQPTLDGWTEAEIAAAIESPRHYGFHATLKAPFRLAADTTPAALRDRLAAFAARQRRFQAPPLKVSAIGPFLALTLSAPSAEMTCLAEAAVRDLDPLRAPLTEKDLQRRLGKGLTPRQEDLLRRWGYPYVLEEFRFHMTLTGPLSEPDLRERLQTALTALFRPELTQPVPVEEICLYSQETQEAPFRLVDRFGFGASPEVKASAEQGQAYP